MVKGQVVRGQWHVSSVLFNTAVDLAGDPMNIVWAILCHFHGGSGMYTIVWWVEVVFVTVAVIYLSPAADPAPLSLSDRVTRWHFIAAVIR